MPSLTSDLTNATHSAKYDTKYSKTISMPMLNFTHKKGSQYEIWHRKIQSTSSNFKCSFYYYLVLQLIKDNKW